MQLLLTGRGHVAVWLRGDVWEEFGRAQEPQIIGMICLMTL